MYTSTKSFSNFPCAHRQYKHNGNCALVHGYSRSFRFEFGSHTLDRAGFCVDFGDLGWLKDYLDHMFDHTLLLMPDDPLLPMFVEIGKAGGAEIRLMNLGVGMEGTAETVCNFADATLREKTKGRCWVISVEARENDKNAATFTNPEAGFKGWL